MSNISLIVAGPADGFLAYRFPGLGVERDDSFALSGSEIQLAEGGIAFRISRVSGLRGGRAEECVRFSAFKQAYEPNLRRTGHSFGAILEFGGRVADVQKIALILIGLLDVIAEHCLIDGRFADARQFGEFVSSTLKSNFGSSGDALFGQLSEDMRRPLSYIQDKRFNSESHFQFLSGVNWKSELIELWRWYLFSPGGSLIASLVAAPADNATPGAMSTKLEDRSHIDSEAGSILIGQLEQALVDISQKRGELEAANAERLRLLNQLRAKDDLLRDSESQTTNLQRLLGEKKAVRTSNLSESDLLSIRQIVAEAVRSNARSAPAINPAPKSSSLDDISLVWWLLIAIVVLASIAAIVFFVAR